nr:hypothetical protein [Paenibacillus bovis]
MRLIATTLSKEWTIQPNEAFDMLLFLNAVSQNDFYRKHYQGVREHYKPIIGEKGINLVDQVLNCLSMSALCKLFSYVEVSSLKDIIQRLRNFEDTYKTIKQNLEANNLEGEYLEQTLENLANNKELFLDCFECMKEAGIDGNWRSNIQPYIQNVAGQLEQTMSVLYPYSQISSKLSTFLSCDLPIQPYRVYLATYIKPISFQLSQQAMVTHQGPPGYMPIPKSIACLCIHETIHGFPGSEFAQMEQKKLRLKSKAFNHQYTNLINNWQSGPEEFFVVGAEAYLSEVLKILSYDECLHYIHNQNNGMSFSLEIYKKLREEKPDKKTDWLGYGNWLIKSMENDVFNIDVLG